MFSTVSGRFNVRPALKNNKTQCCTPLGKHLGSEKNLFFIEKDIALLRTMPLVSYPR